MATKRRKKWWQMLRGPRGHRGLPGPTGPASGFVYPEDVLHDLQTKYRIISERMTELERKLGGSQK